VSMMQFSIFFTHLSPEGEGMYSSSVQASHTHPLSKWQEEQIPKKDNVGSGPIMFAQLKQEPSFKTSSVTYPFSESHWHSKGAFSYE